MKAYNDHVLFAGGGTAGHLFPGLAVADYLRRHAPQVRITFAGTGKSLETRHVARAGHDYVRLLSRPFPARARDALRFFADNLGGYYAARRLLRESGVSLVVGLGGYASVPAARAAAKLGVPYILLEQNAVPGRATRWLAPGAEAVCSTFENIESQLRAGSRVRVTGNPIRHDFTLARLAARAVPDPLQPDWQLLVLGGSGGSQTLNEQVPRALYKARAAIGNWQIVHQSGERDAEGTRELYRKLGLKAHVLPFIHDLPRLLSTTHLAISRAGGTTLAELAASGVPSILLPYPKATHDHQRKNADVFVAAGGCRLVDERDVEGRLDNALAETIIELACNHAQRVRMTGALLRLAKPRATRHVAQLIAETLAAKELAEV